MHTSLKNPRGKLLFSIHNMMSHIKGFVLLITSVKTLQKNNVITLRC